MAKRISEEKRIQKAASNLKFWKEDLEFWRLAYVELRRNPTMKRYKSMKFTLAENPYDKQMNDIMRNIEEAKAKIAKFERIVL